MVVITIGLLTFNRANLITRAIESVVNQTFKDFELIISDDNSFDNTKEVIGYYCIDDTRIKYIKQTGIGMTKNFLEVLKLAKGKYFMWLCDDDYLSEDYLEKTISFLKNNKNYSLVCGTTKFFDNSGVWDRKEVLELEDENALKRVINYFKKVNSNIILYGLMTREEISNFIYPDTFGADLFWSSQIVYSGKVKVLSDTFFYYSKEGISSDTHKLSQYYQQSQKKENPYFIVRKVAFDIINQRLGAFKFLKIVESKLLAIRVWLILRDRFCLSKTEAKIRYNLAIRSRIIALFK